MKNMNKFINYLEVKLNQAIELFDLVTIEQTEENGEKEEKSDYKTVQHQSSINFLQTLFSWFGYYIYKSYQPINIEVIRIIPQVNKI